ncbi:MAG: hypothetical protein ACK417_04560 [Bacteroidia bacterium]
MTEESIFNLFDKKKYSEIISLAASLSDADKSSLSDYACFLVFFTYNQSNEHQKAAQWAGMLVTRRELSLNKDVFFNFLSLSAVSFFENGSLVRAVQMLELSLKLRTDKQNQRFLTILQDKFFRKTAEKIHWIGAVFILFKIAMDFMAYNSLLMLLATSFFLLHVMAYVAIPALLSRIYWSILGLYLRTNQHVVKKEAV